MTIFKVGEVIQKKITIEKETYIGLIDLLDIPQNDSKDTYGTTVIVFGIKVDTSYFTICLPKDRLEKVIRVITKVLS